MMQKVKDIALAGHVTDAEQSWWRVLLPVSTRLGREISGLDLGGRTASCFQHVTMTNAWTLLPLIEAGARLRIAAVNPDSTDDTAAAFLAEHGAEVWAWSRMGDEAVAEGLEWLLSEPADAVSDMGGELIAGYAQRGIAPAGALEATTSGLHRLTDLEIPFPVYDWNSIPLKDRLHNRHHVGLTAWPAFSAITGLALHGRSVLVIGFGPVGRGVALHARALGAVVSVAELDPVRALEAQHHGCREVSLDEGLATSSVVVTATGFEGVLGPEQLRRLRPDAIVVNVGHSNREIDVAWLEQQPHEPVRQSIDRYTIDGRDVFLLNRGSLVNLAPGSGVGVDEYFDPFAAIILQGLAWILTGGAEGARSGLQPYPQHLEQAIADLARRART
jgi:adenosylhomocysteinase